MKTPKTKPRRGEIWRVDLEPTRGKETQSFKTSESDTRPVLVLVRAGVGESGVRLCAPITGYLPARDELCFWRVEIGDSDESGLSKISCADVSQARALDLSRFVRKDGAAHPTETQVSAAMLALLVGADDAENA